MWRVRGTFTLSEGPERARGLTAAPLFSSRKIYNAGVRTAAKVFTFLRWPRLKRPSAFGPRRLLMLQRCVQPTARMTSLWLSLEQWRSCMNPGCNCRRGSSWQLTAVFKDEVFYSNSLFLNTAVSSNDGTGNGNYIRVHLVQLIHPDRKPVSADTGQ